MAGGSELTSRELLLAMQNHHAQEEKAEALELARAAWASRSGGEPRADDDLAELGEAWRFAMLAATRDGEQPERLVWRVRALAAFVRSGCSNGAAMLCLPSFFEAVHDDRTRPEEVLAILDTMASLTDPDGAGPEPASIISSVEEKRGYFLTQAAASETHHAEQARLFAEAESAYASALAAEEDPRRQAKIEAAATTPAYLAASSPDQREAAWKRLEVVLTRIESSGIDATDVLRIGRHNLSVMQAGGQELEPYEIT